LPNNFFPIPIHVQDMPNDNFQPRYYCDIINKENMRRKSDSIIQGKLTTDHRDVLNQMATLMG